MTYQIVEGGTHNGPELTPEEKLAIAERNLLWSETVLNYALERPGHIRELQGKSAIADGIEGRLPLYRERYESDFVKFQNALADLEEQKITHLRASA